MLSIIIPFYKGEKFFSRLLQSITNSMVQVSQNAEKIAVELLVIVDSVETETAYIQFEIEKANIPSLSIDFHILKNEKNLGVAASRNKALQLAKGAYVYLIDQDDELLPNFFKRIFALLKPGIYDFILVNGQEFLTNLNVFYKAYYFTPNLTISALMTDDFIRTPGQVILKKEKIVRSGGFPVPEKHKGSDDRYAWIALFTKFPNLKHHYVAEPLIRWHIHGGNYSLTGNEIAFSCLELWEKCVANGIINPQNAYYLQDVKRLKYLVGNASGFVPKLEGFLLQLRYKFRPNKILRKLIKSILSKGFAIK